ncbi:MAG TPA: acyl-CoA dehydrogenase [Candidatus Dormibacteraeota bacterium]|nr:acyl-CoA dehydrogenase [Candidatus Dormibacteraeota bacterium]
MARDTDEVDDVIDGLGDFLDAEVVARHRLRNDELVDRAELYGPDGRFRPEVLELVAEVRQASARAGFYGMFLPDGDGGPQLGYEGFYRVWEFILRRCGAEYWLGHHVVAHWARGPGHLAAAIGPALRDEVLPDLLAGRTTTCFAMSEPDAGSDAWRMRTRAERTSSGTWRISGTKQWITNAPYATHAFVFAVTDDALVETRRGGVTAFIVPTDAPGFHVDRVIRFFGHAGGDEGIVSFTNVEVSDDHVVGEVNEGFRLAMQGVSLGRLYNSARAVGMALWALDRAAEYASSRETFGRSIIANQGISFPLADRATEAHAARLMGLNCARLLDRGHDVRTELSMTKLYSTEMAVRAVDTAMQTHGAMGFTNEVALGEAWHQMRRICVADGSSEMMRRQITAGFTPRGGSPRVPG